MKKVVVLLLTMAWLMPAVYADSITIDGQQYTKVLVYELENAYLIRLPDEGKTINVKKSQVSSVSLTPDYGERDQLLIKYEETRDTLAESEAVTIAPKPIATPAKPKSNRKAPVRKNTGNVVPEVLNQTPVDTSPTSTPKAPEPIPISIPAVSSPQQTTPYTAPVPEDTMPVDDYDTGEEGYTDDEMMEDYEYLNDDYDYDDDYYYEEEESFPSPKLISRLIIFSIFFGLSSIFYKD